MGETTGVLDKLNIAVSESVSDAKRYAATILAAGCEGSEHACLVMPY
jgi:hypothetical protein